jgi:adenylate kinase
MRCILSEKEIEDLIEKLAGQVFDRNHDDMLHVHVIMNGAFMFAADFVRKYEGIIAEITFTRILRSYGINHPPVEPRMMDEPPYVPNKKYHHVLLDVVYEEGKTSELYKKMVFRNTPKYCLTECYLLYKNTFTPPENMFVGKMVSDAGFLTGYGMGPYRDFPKVMEIQPKEVL